jgi:hypothetical protein
METNMQQELRTIDITPTWSALMPLLWETAAKGDANSRAELMRLARIVDQLNEKAEEEQS